MPAAAVDEVTKLGVLQSAQQRGRETVTRVVAMLAGHDLNHTMQIEDRLSKT
jgi:hypothetical protein